MNKIETILNAIAIAYGIETIETILGCIILILNIVLILVRLCFNIYNKIKIKHYKDITQDIKETIEELDKIKKEDDKNV